MDQHSVAPTHVMERVFTQPPSGNVQVIYLLAVRAKIAVGSTTKIPIVQAVKVCLYSQLVTMILVVFHIVVLLYARTGAAGAHVTIVTVGAIVIRRATILRSTNIVVAGRSRPIRPSRRCPPAPP